MASFPTFPLMPGPPTAELFRMERGHICQGKLRSSDFVQRQIRFVCKKQVKYFSHLERWKFPTSVFLLTVLGFLLFFVCVVCFLLLISGRLCHISKFWQTTDGSDKKQTSVICNHCIQWRLCLHFHLYLHSLPDCFN